VDLEIKAQIERKPDCLSCRRRHAPPLSPPCEKGGDCLRMRQREIESKVGHIIALAAASWRLGRGVFAETLAEEDLRVVLALLEFERMKTVLEKHELRKVERCSRFDAFTRP